VALFFSSVLKKSVVVEKVHREVAKARSKVEQTIPSFSPSIDSSLANLAVKQKLNQLTISFAT
jgi:hypothetical protein